MVSGTMRSVAAVVTTLAFTLISTAQSTTPLSTNVNYGSPLPPIRLRTEYLDTPLTIDQSIPRFSWALAHTGRDVRQVGYAINVWELPSQKMVWASQHVVSNRSVNVPYNGSPLSSDTDYGWSVQWTDLLGQTSEPTNTTFSTALLTPADWHSAAWVSSPSNGSLNTYRTTFHVTGPVTRARLYVAGLGFAKTYINGNLTDSHELGQFVTFQKRVLYDCVDVTSLVTAGSNALGIMLGNGWFADSSIGAGPPQFRLLLSVTTSNGLVTMYTSAVHAAEDATTDNGQRVEHAQRAVDTEGDLERVFKRQERSRHDPHPNPHHTAPNGTAPATVTPLSFMATVGPSVVPAVNLGEVYDGRVAAALRGFSTVGYTPGANPSWAPATSPDVGPGHYGSVMSTHTVTINTDRDYPAVALTQPSPGVYVFDFGQNMAGQVTLKVAGCDAGHVISMQHTEILYPDGHAHNAFCERPKYWLCGVQQMANYTCNGGQGPGGEETYRVTFVSMGFRYVQVLGFPGTPTLASLTAHFIHSTLEPVGQFVSSSLVLNKIQHATHYAALSNAMDIPTDCPQRERRGWLGDAQIAFETVLHNFDTGAFYTKWVRDLADTQEYNAATLGTQGALPDCAPFYGHGKAEADPGWGIAGWVVPMGMAEYFDDNRLDTMWYPHAKAYADHWMAVAMNNSGVLPLISYGDWGNVIPGPLSFKPEIYPQFFYVQGLTMQSQLARRLGYSADAETYTTAANAAKAVLLKRFFNATTACFGNCTDVEQIMGLASGALPDGSVAETAAWSNAISWFDASNTTHPERFGGGIVSLKLLYPLLDKFNMSDLGLKFQLHTDAPPSFGYWMAQNATTMWEDWTNSATEFNSGLNSYNHIMFGSTGVWYYTTLAGMKKAPGTRSWNSLIIAPPRDGLLQILDWANASIDTPIGTIRSAWSVPTHSTITSRSTPTSASAAASAAAPASATATAPAATADRLGEVYRLDITVPPNAAAVVDVPTVGPATTASVLEGGHAVWSGGKFVPGVAGVVSATVGTDGRSIVFQVMSGTYSFIVQQ
eukprot:m.29376 g.29376  ORF g.29376 m.29376 type:complete len:1049 (+) comp4590_c0_seq1:93-3239(+)